MSVLPRMDNIPQICRETAPSVQRLICRRLDGKTKVVTHIEAAGDNFKLVVPRCKSKEQARELLGKAIGFDSGLNPQKADVTITKTEDHNDGESGGLPCYNAELILTPEKIWYLADKLGVGPQVQKELVELNKARHGLKIINRLLEKALPEGITVKGASSGWGGATLVLSANPLEAVLPEQSKDAKENKLDSCRREIFRIFEFDGDTEDLGHLRESVHFTTNGKIFFGFFGDLDGPVKFANRFIRESDAVREQERAKAATRLLEEIFPEGTEIAHITETGRRENVGVFTQFIFDRPLTGIDADFNLYRKKICERLAIDEGHVFQEIQPIHNSSGKADILSGIEFRNPELSAVLEHAIDAFLLRPPSREDLQTSRRQSIIDKRRFLL